MTEKSSVAHPTTPPAEKQTAPSPSGPAPKVIAQQRLRQGLGALFQLSLDFGTNQSEANPGIKILQ